MRQALKRLSALAARGAELSGSLRLLERASRNRRDLLRVLMYHRVAPTGADPELHPGLISATPEGFRLQMEFLADQYDVISLEEVLVSARQGSRLPPRSVLITFDDAYCDFATHAWPVLRHLGLAVTLFVPTAYPDRPRQTFWWDRLHQALASTRHREVAAPHGTLQLDGVASRMVVFKRLREQIKCLPHDEAMHWVDRICGALGCSEPVHRVLGWDDLRKLSRGGVTLAAHTRTHPLLNRIPAGRVRDEVVGSLNDLEREIGTAPAVLAYPSGGYDDTALRVLREEGFELALTTDRGIHQLRGGDPLRIPRIPVGLRFNRAAFRARLLPWAGSL